MLKTLAFLAAVALAFYITTKRFQHRFIPKGVHKQLRDGSAD